MYMFGFEISKSLFGVYSSWKLVIFGLEMFNVRFLELKVCLKVRTPLDIIVH